MKTYIEYFKGLSEDMPTNNVGSGNVSGLGVGVNSEPPGVIKKTKRKNKEKHDGGAKSTRKG